MSDVQRQIRGARVSRALFVTAAVILAALFAVASGSLVAGAMDGFAAVLFVASAALATARIRIMRRTLAPGPAPLPVRERALRRVARRPRTTMTPEDYRQLREMETGLGWEPSETPAGDSGTTTFDGASVTVRAHSGHAAALSGSGSMTWLASDCCRCGDDVSSVQVHVPESTAPLRSYCLECGQQAKRAKATARVAERAAKALEVKDATEAAQHFAQLARVGRERCIGFCPICAERQTKTKMEQWLDEDRWEPLPDDGTVTSPYPSAAVRGHLDSAGRAWCQDASDSWWIQPTPDAPWFRQNKPDGNDR